MLRGPLYSDGYRPQLWGHETFPLRYGWLKKAFDAVCETEDQDDNRYVFSGPDAIARFGVGKNMVASMRHWAAAAGIVKDAPDSKRISTTTLGRRLFDRNGLDPYMEEPATSWLVHWNLCGQPAKTTWFWSFNHYPALSFEREGLVQAIAKLAKDRGWPRAALATIKSDVACFVRTYVAQPLSGGSNQEDGLESPLTELGLIKPIGRRDGFRFVRGPKPSLGVGAFGYAVTDFWNERFPGASTLSFEALAHEPGSPGRVFLLDENDVVDMLASLEEATKGAYRWSETAGLKQLIRSETMTAPWAIELATADYSSGNKRSVA